MEKKAQDIKETCINCGKPIKNKRFTYYCSSECMRAVLGETRRNIYCVVCGKELPKIKRKYCSAACANKGHSLNENKPISNTNDGFAEYERAAAEAKKRGEWLSYGEFMARKAATKKKGA